MISERKQTCHLHDVFALSDVSGLPPSPLRFVARGACVTRDLTWIEIELLNRAAALDILLGRCLKLWNWNKSFPWGCDTQKSLSTILQLLLLQCKLMRKSLSGPQCITWHCNYTVWPLQTLASKPGTLLGGYLYDILLQRHVLWFPVRFNRDILPSSTLLSK